ncbi:MAG: FecR domain-containing protein [Fidelibacterota bacterium]
MKQLVLTLTIITMLVSGALAQGKEFAKITLPLGRVQVQKSGSGAWVKALPNMKLYEKDVLKTLSKSRCEITLVGGGKIRIGENSELELSEAKVKPMDKSFNANLKKGDIWVSAKAAFGEKKNVSVRTPTAVAAIRGTKYRAKAGEAESSVLVYRGKVDVNSLKNVIEEREKQLKQKGTKGGAGKPKFTLGPVKEIKAPTQVAGPYEVSLEDWVSLVEGMQINVRKDGKYNLFKFDQDADAGLDFVKWNKELDGEAGE